MKRKPKHAMSHEGVYARIKQSKIHGVGVFAICDIPKDTKLFPEDEGEIIWKKKSALNLDEMPQEIRQLYDQFCLIKNKGETYGCPKSFNLMTIAWYLNHSKTPNVGCDQDYAFYALRDIKKGEELAADYQTYNEFSNAKWV
jgi:SET domain-containing protein